MNDDNLKQLKEIEAPLPRPQAWDRAINAGLAAFEEAGREEREKIARITQGSHEDVRPTPTIFETLWEWMMKHRVFVGCVALAAVAVPVTFNVLDQETKTFDVANLTLSNEREPMPKGVPEQLMAKRGDQSKRGNKKADGVIALPASTEVLREEKTVANGPVSGDADDVSNIVATPNPRPAEPSKDEFRTATAPATTSIAPKQTASSSPADTAGVRRVPTVSLPVQTGARQQQLGVFGVSEAPSGNNTSKAERKRIAAGYFHDQQPPVYVDQDRDQFAEFESNPAKLVKQDPVSTFSIDVDTSSYAFARKMLLQGRLPEKNAVRVEEMINYFNYDYPRPTSADVPFRPTISVYPTPWNPETKLLHIGIKGYDVMPEEKPRSNLVFLIDVSGSMNAPDKLPLLKTAFRLLVNKLEPEDTVSIVTYAGRAGTVLEPTQVAEKRKILAALDRLQSGGSTAGAQGIRQAYALAEENFDKAGVNRVILATDGDFNVGIVDRGQLKDYIAKKRKTGIFLSILGFGAGNYNDALMQVLAQNGNGNAAYIDTVKEAQKVLVQEAGSTLFPIAKDVKIQIEFNPALVSEYRLIGYETRALRNEDFNNDKVDAGDIGSGHTVTAIYEITPVGAKSRQVDKLRYSANTRENAPTQIKTDANTSEYAFLKLRYKRPDEDTSKLITLPVTRDIETATVNDAPIDIRFAASVAAFGQKLRDSTRLSDFGYEEIAKLASGARGTDPFGYRSEFVTLVKLAETLSR